MGQKCHPILLRVGKVLPAISGKLNSTQFGYRKYNFFAKTKREYSTKLNNAIKIEDYIKNDFAKYGIGEIYVSFVQNNVIVDVFSAKVGNLIGKNASGIEAMRKKILSIIKVDGTETATINMHEIKKVNLDANIVCHELSKEIEKKRGNANIKKMADIVMKAGAMGVKIKIAGRISGAEIAREDKVKRGLINATTLKANISYSQKTALTQYGIIGIQTFINLGSIS
ncbi:MAG: 30S ribosomal protein S3 [Rickettsiales bacterium]